MTELNQREITVLQNLADGSDGKTVAKTMNVSYQRIRIVLCDIRKKLEAETTENAVATALRRGIID